jgi:hypothetical protein
MENPVLEKLFYWSQMFIDVWMERFDDAAETAKLLVKIFDRYTIWKGGWKLKKLC